MFKRKSHDWPRRKSTERRVHPRVRMSFPIEVMIDPEAPPVRGLTLDLGLGGIRATIDRYLELFLRLQVRMDLPITERDGDVRMETVESTVAVVRIDPDEEGVEGTEYDVALAFTRSTPEQDRVIGTFLLQSLLFDPEAELL